MLVIRRNDRVVLHFSAGPLLKLIALHSRTEVLDLFAVESVLADAKFESIVLRCIVACGDLYASVNVEMKQRKIKQRCRTNTNVVNLQATMHRSTMDSNF